MNKVRVVYGMSNWPEEPGKEFSITEVRANETDGQAFARARKLYSNSIALIIKEINKESP